MTSQYFAADSSAAKPEDSWNDWGDWGENNNNNNNMNGGNAMSQIHQVKQQPVLNQSFVPQSQAPFGGPIYSPFAYQQPQHTQVMSTPNYQQTMPPQPVATSSNDSFYPENRERLDDVGNQQTASPALFTDRHNYLVTGQLPQDRTTWPPPPPPQEELPPPVLISRMVVGQPENNEEQIAAVNPLPSSLNRMVTGTEMPPTAYTNYSRQADGEVSHSPTSITRPQASLPFTHFHNQHQIVPEVAQQSFNTSDRNLYLVAGESDVNDHRVIPGVESNSSVPASIMNPMQNLHIQDDDDFVNVLSSVPERAVDVDGMETTSQEHRPVGSQSREEDIDGANDHTELPSVSGDHGAAAHLSNDLETDVREEAIEGANDYNDEVQKVDDSPKNKVERKKPESVLSSEDSELRELELSKLNSKSRRNRKYVEDSNESENDYSDGDKRVKSRRVPREKISREDYENFRRKEKERRSGDRPRKGDDTDGSKYGEPKRRTDDENDYRRNRDKYKKSSRNDDELEEKEKRRRDKYRDSGSRKKDYTYDDDRRERRRRYHDDESYSGRRSQNTSDREYASDRYNRRSREHVEKERKYDPNSYYQQYAGYDQSSYNYNSYYQQQQYYETLRRTNPQAYYEWYTKYIAMMQQQAQARQQQATTVDDIGGSMRSGYSSSNEKDRLSSSRFIPGGDVTNPLRGMNSSFIDNTDYQSLQGFPSVVKDMTQAYSSLNYGYDHISRGKNSNSGTEAQRLTPKKFQSLHTYVKLSNGIMTTIDSSNNDNAYTVRIVSFPILDKCKRLYQLYPGPLVRSVSHKKTVIEFCEEKLKQDQHIAMSHRASYSLLWSYLILMLRQNGNYNETDISELLMKNAEAFKTSLENSGPDEKNVANEDNTDASDSDEVAVSEKNSNSASQSQEETTNMSMMSSKAILHKFRDYLLYGNINDALDFATDNNLWGHALFLASKVDRRQHANVMLKFANKLPYNDPLQTLYQIMSGRMPACVTNLDDKWGDWRSHLAMIISNCTDKPELVKRSIIALGDSLSTRGDIFGSQFCYLLVEPSFREYSDVTSESKIALLGVSHQMPFKKFATDDAIIMSEVYEYARSLSEEHFFISSLQRYKFLLAGKMLDYGMQLKSLMYMEQIAKCIIAQPSVFDESFKCRVYSMADRLKFYDPVMEKSYEDNYNNNGTETSEDQTWLQDLAAIIRTNGDSSINQEQLLSHEQTPQHSTNDVYNPMSYQQAPATLTGVYDPLSQHSTPTHAATNEEVNEPYQVNHDQPSNENFNQSQYQSDSSYSYEYNNPMGQPQMTSQPPQVYEQATYDPTSYHSAPVSTDYGYGWNHNASYQQQQPTITLGNTTSKKFDEPAQKNLESEEAKKISPTKQKTGKEKKGSLQDGSQAQGGGWFGGIFSKLSMKPKNQMILPDDKNPTILWDEAAKKWVNKDGGGSEAEAFKPPPKMGAIMGSSPQPMTAPMSQQQVQPSHLQLPNNHIESDPSYIQHQAPPSHLQQVPSQHQQVSSQHQPLSPAPVHENLAQQPPTTNMFKMQKGRNLKKSYVDILGSSGQTVSQPKELAPQMDMQFFNPVLQQQQGMQFYNPNDFQ